MKMPLFIYSQPLFETLLAQKVIILWNIFKKHDIIFALSIIYWLFRYLNNLKTSIAKYKFACANILFGNKILLISYGYII